MNRQERLKSIKDLLDRYGNNEVYFETLYAKLLEEFDIEYQTENDYRKNHYLNNLRQTRDKQANLYIVTNGRRPKKGAPDEYKDFIRHFRHDITEATHQ